MSVDDAEEDAPVSSVKGHSDTSGSKPPNTGKDQADDTDPSKPSDGPKPGHIDTEPGDEW